MKAEERSMKADKRSIKADKRSIKEHQGKGEEHQGKGEEHGVDRPICPNFTLCRGQGLGVRCRPLKHRIAGPLGARSGACGTGCMPRLPPAAPCRRCVEPHRPCMRTSTKVDEEGMSGGSEEARREVLVDKFEAQVLAAFRYCSSIRQFRILFLAVVNLQTNA